MAANVGTDVRVAHSGHESMRAQEAGRAAGILLWTRTSSTSPSASTAMSSIGFTGTPVEKDDINTRSVFGDYIDVHEGLSL
jgi:type I site-specific restriction-modification system R (restriction) subunit